MIVIGLTGGIGMGKSTAAQLLRRMGHPIYSADAAVHDLLRKGGAAVGPAGRAFPESLKRGAIDRKILARAVFGQPEKLRRLERIIHPRLRKAEREFLRQARKDKALAAILEIPLLFETGAETRCDAVLCVTAPRAVQKHRVLSRPGMTIEKFRAIVARQLPDAEKRRRADFVIATGGGIAATERHLARAMKVLLVKKEETKRASSCAAAFETTAISRGLKNVFASKGKKVFAAE